MEHRERELEQKIPQEKLIEKPKETEEGILARLNLTKGQVVKSILWITHLI